VCALVKGVCTGCGRTQDEIREWFIATDDRKIEILDRIKNETTYFRLVE
jgi:predicted Fe-S protein YdhL (DUF1289 family)